MNQKKNFFYYVTESKFYLANMIVSDKVSIIFCSLFAAFYNIAYEVSRLPRELALGNGSLLVNFDRDLNMRDFYYPRVGLENHIMAHRNRIGIWVDGEFAWLDNPAWEKKIGYKKESLVGDMYAAHKGLKLELTIVNGVHFKRNVFLQKMTVKNTGDQDREIRLFLTFDFSLNENAVADTAFYDPTRSCLCHYKRNTYLLASGRLEDEGIYQFSIGKKRFEGSEGTWRDAEDGCLEGHPIDHGSIDSVISFRHTLKNRGQVQLMSWIAAGGDIAQVWRENDWVAASGVEHLLKETETYWQSWVNRKKLDFYDLSDQVVDMYKRSLLVVRSQIDDGGAVLAATDSELLLYYPDDYNYVWPRDGALVAYTLDRAGYPELAFTFYDFCAGIISEGGYFFHKYNPDGTLGSSWHPWWKHDKIQLPIQEDETALVIFALGQHCRRYGDIERLKPLYEILVLKGADFLLNYREKATGLPLPSYDLWEERRGVFTFTTAAVWAALNEAAYLAELFGDTVSSLKYRAGADAVKEAIEKYLYCPETGRFLRGVYPKEGGGLEKDLTLDSSVYALFEFGVFPAGDERVRATMEAVKKGLAVRTEIGGMARYTNDYYAKKSEDIANVPGNPWFICTLWLAEWYADYAIEAEDMRPAREILEWAVQYARPSGVMSEQVHPYTGEDVSVSPLTWSHATFVLAVGKYLDKLDALTKKDVGQKEDSGYN